MQHVEKFYLSKIAWSTFSFEKIDDFGCYGECGLAEEAKADKNIQVGNYRSNIEDISSLRCRPRQSEMKGSREGPQGMRYCVGRCVWGWSPLVPRGNNAKCLWIKEGVQAFCSCMSSLQNTTESTDEQMRKQQFKGLCDKQGKELAGLNVREWE